MSLDGLSTNGRFCVLAIDHRDSMRAFLSPDDPAAVSPERLTSLKIDVIREASRLATGVMLEPEYSIPQVLEAGALAEGVGFCAALESQGYLGRLGEHPTTILEGWGVSRGGGIRRSRLQAPVAVPSRTARSLPISGRWRAEVIAECRRVGLPVGAWSRCSTTWMGHMTDGGL